jgi:hypothetical protein
VTRSGESDPGNPVTVDGVPSSPPPEVWDAIAVAAGAAARLEQAGRELRFTTDPQTGRPVVELHDRDGNVLDTLSPIQVLEIASGGTLDRT